MPWTVDAGGRACGNAEAPGKLRSESSEVPIIITTGNNEDAIRERAQQAGCTAFVWKPYGAETILPLLASIVRQSHT